MGTTSALLVPPCPPLMLQARTEGGELELTTARMVSKELPSVFTDRRPDWPAVNGSHSEEPPMTPQKTSPWLVPPMVLKTWVPVKPATMTAWLMTPGPDSVWD